VKDFHLPKNLKPKRKKLKTFFDFSIEIFDSRCLPNRFNSIYPVKLGKTPRR